MLKKWIDEIRSKSDLYKSDCWKYQISGNVLELSILHAYIKKKESYRCSVVAIGQVLRALSKKIEKEFLNFHIQSFPSLENPEIVATIRTGKRNDFKENSSHEKNKACQYQDIVSTIKTVAKQYQIQVHLIEKPSGKEDIEEVSLDNYSTWIALSSEFNNPFTWLNVGYFKESLRTDISGSLKSESLCIIDFCSIDYNQFPNLDLPKNRSIQSLVGVQSTNRSVE